jgi:hypothetical protein
MREVEVLAARHRVPLAPLVVDVQTLSGVEAPFAIYTIIFPVADLDGPRPAVTPPIGEMDDPSGFEVVFDPNVAVERSIQSSEEPGIQDLHVHILLFEW